MIAALGIQIVSKADLKSQRNIMIIGFAFLMGLGVGNYAANLPSDLWGNKDITAIILNYPDNFTFQSKYDIILMSQIISDFLISKKSFIPINFSC